MVVITTENSNSPFTHTTLVLVSVQQIPSVHGDHVIELISSRLQPPCRLVNCLSGVVGSLVGGLRDQAS